MTDENVSFEHVASFDRGEISGNVRLGKLESMYEELFAEVIEDGVITAEERGRLDKMADSLGLDRSRLRKLEQALEAAYTARHRVTIRDLAPMSQSGQELPRQSLVPLEPATDQRTLALERRIKQLEARIQDLENDLEDARAHISVDVDFSDVSSKGNEEEAADLARRVRHDPRDVDSLHALFTAYEKDLDRQLSVAHVLSYLGAANPKEKALFEKHRSAGLIRPTSSLSRESWTRLLFHPEEEPLTGEIFSVVVSAVLMGRLSALRRDKALPKLDPEKKQDPEKTTLQSVRCFVWAASILGMNASPIYIDPEWSGAVELAPAMPPATRLGGKALSGRSAKELSFMAGRHLAHFREEHFVKLLVPSARDLEDIFLAALSIGNPGLPLNAQVKELVVPIAKAIEPILESNQVDRLRGHFLRFVEEGGRTNLQRWASAVDKTGARTGLLLADDLRAAHSVIELEDKAHLEPKMDDLLAFMLSDRYAKLRKQIGIAVS